MFERWLKGDAKLNGHEHRSDAHLIDMRQIVKTYQSTAGSFTALKGVDLQIDRGEWNSYRIHYIHPIETGDLTGYLTAIGNERYLDVMPARGEDRGSFLLPLHAMLHLRLEGDRLDLAPLSYEWFAEQLRAGRPIAGLNATLDQKENALLVSPVDRLRDWLRIQSVDGPRFGAPATFARQRSR